MKALIYIILFVTLSACNSNNVDKSPSANPNKNDTVIKHDTIYIDNSNNSDWQNGFNLTHEPDKDSVWGKPVSYYLNDKDCVSIAFEFYYGYFRPSDNGATEELLKYAATDNNKLRPFYRWCLNKTIQVSDGALAEYIGTPALHYAEKFPKEFFEYMDSDTTGEKYKEWVSAISYSGFNTNDDKSKTLEIKRYMVSMKSNCKNCDSFILKRIEKFLNDCY